MYSSISDLANLQNSKELSEDEIKEYYEEILADCIDFFNTIIAFSTIRK